MSFRHWCLRAFPWLWWRCRPMRNARKTARARASAGLWRKSIAHGAMPSAAGAGAPIRRRRAFRGLPSAIPTTTRLPSSSTGLSFDIPECRSSGFWSTKPTDLWPTSAGYHANGDHDPCCFSRQFAEPARPPVHGRSAHERSASIDALRGMRHGCQFSSGPCARLRRSGSGARHRGGGVRAMPSHLGTGQ